MSEKDDTRSGVPRSIFSTEQREGDALLSKECLRFLRHVENEVSYYPVAESSVDKSLTTSH